MSKSLSAAIEILERLEIKVDRINGSVAAVTDRVIELEKQDISYKAALQDLQEDVEQHRKATSNLIWKVGAPVAVSVLSSALIFFLIRS